MKRRDIVILKKIVSEIDILEGMLKDTSLQEFNEDIVLQRAAAMASINIGELVKHLSEEFFDAYPQRDLRMAARTRDAYAHGYYSLSFAQVYETSRNDYPRVKSWIESILADELHNEDNV